MFLKRINELARKLVKPSFPEIIYVETYRGKDRITSMREHEKLNNLPPGKESDYIFISIPSRQQLEEARLKEY